MSNATRSRFAVTVEGHDDQSRAPLINRLRQWLKKGWREFGLRCVSGQEIEMKGTDSEAQQDPGEEQAK